MNRPPTVATFGAGNEPESEPGDASRGRAAQEARAVGRVLLVGFEASTRTSLEERLDGMQIEVLDGLAALPGALEAAPVVAACLGPGTDIRSLYGALEKLAERGLVCPPLVVAGVPPQPTGEDGRGDLVAELSRAGRLLYRSAQPLGADDLAAVVLAASLAGQPSSATSDDDESIEALDAELAACRDAEAGTEQLARALREDLGAAHADVWIETADGGRMRGVRMRGTERIITLDAGVVGFAGRTGTALRSTALDQDPRFVPEADLPPGIAPGPALVHGVRDAIPRRAVVIAVYRRPTEPMFEDREQHRLTQLIDRARPHLRRWAAAEKSQEAMVAGARGLYRSEALSTYLDGATAEGDLLRNDPGWTRLTYRLMLGFLALAVLFTIVARVGDYAEGPAVIRFGERVEVTAREIGTVDQVLVSANQAVDAGDLLVRLHGPNEAAEVMRLEQEFALRLRQRLRDPSNRSAEQELIAIRTHLELARTKLEAFEVRAPEAGVVSDVRIRPGLHLGAGAVLLSLVTDQRQLSVLALLPGAARPTLEPGQSLRIELTGYPGTHHDVEVASVGQEVIGPAEARRAFGGTIADAIQIDGPVVLVEATLSSPTFENDGRELTLHDGMQGIAEVKTRTRPLLYQLVPGLEGLLDGRSRG